MVTLEELELKITNLTRSFNILVDRLSRAGIKGTLDFSDLETEEEFSYSEDINSEELEEKEESNKDEFNL